MPNPNQQLKRTLLLLTLNFLSLSVAIGQQYPVQGTLAINSPYPANLSDYANPNIEKLVLHLTLTY